MKSNQKHKAQLDQIPYLLHHISFTIDGDMNQLLEERLGIGVSQRKILHVLHERSAVAQNVIAAALGQTESSVSRQVDYMHQKGLIDQKRDSNDKRRQLTILTLKGHTLYQEAKKLEQHYFQNLLKDMSDKDIAKLQELLELTHVAFGHETNHTQCG
jgi:DNA-binding MarR family transcriptional regulator